MKQKLKWLASFRSISQSKEQDELFNELCKRYKQYSICRTIDYCIISKGISNIAIVAHLDINQPNYQQCEIKQVGNMLYSSNKNVGVGFDDKAGIAFAMHCLETLDNINVVFTTNEEIGCIGAKQVILPENINFLIQLDRRGNSDISEYTNGIDVVNDDIKTILNDILIKYGFKWTKCVYTDIGEIAANNEVQAVNISCGYYNEHTPQEYLNYNEFKTSCEFAMAIINRLQGKELTKLEQPEYEYWNDLGMMEFDYNNTFDLDYNFKLHDFVESLTQREINELKDILINY